MYIYVYIYIYIYIYLYIYIIETYAISSWRKTGKSSVHGLKSMEISVVV